MRLRSSPSASSFCRRAETGNAGKIFGAGAQALLLAAAHQLRRERGASAYDQGAGALRPAQLVCRKVI